MESVRTGSKVSERSDHAIIDIEIQYLSLATSVRKELEMSYSIALSGEYYSIDRVSEKLRQLDEKAYKPRIISIGPLHHGRQELKAMEKYKRKYLHDFLQRTQVSLEDFIEFIKEKEELVRSCYAESIELNSDDFVKMILMDSFFIIEVFLRNFFQEFDCDPLYSNPRKINDVKDDMWMLENQLPFFILDDLFTLANITCITSDQNEKISMLHIIHEFAITFWSYMGIGNLEERDYSRVKHLVDFLRICILPSKLQMEDKLKILTAPSVKELHQAGVKFKLGPTRNIFDIKFRNGILEIPLISVNSPMEYLFKNLLAFEQCQDVENLLNDYVILLNYLVRTPKDVDLLVQYKIIDNPLGDSKQVTTIFQNLVKEIRFDTKYYFSSLVEDLNGYCRRPWHKWKATLKQDYLKTPWTTISVIVAVVLLILTFIQAVCSILQVK